MTAATATTSRLTAGAVGAVLLGAVRLHRPDGLTTLCPLRALTGIPCPLCGTTTAVVRLGQGRVASALAANPVTLLGLALLALAPLLAGRVRVPHRAAPWLLTCAIASAWTWQLARFGKLPL